MDWRRRWALHSSHECSSLGRGPGFNLIQLAPDAPTWHLYSLLSLLPYTVRRAGQTKPFHRMRKGLVLSRLFKDTQVCDRCPVPQPIPSWDIATFNLDRTEASIPATAQVNRWVYALPSFWFHKQNSLLLINSILSPIFQANPVSFRSGAIH